jgi:hypothetical protein
MRRSLIPYRSHHHHHHDSTLPLMAAVGSMASQLLPLCSFHMDSLHVAHRQQIAVAPNATAVVSRGDPAASLRVDQALWEVLAVPCRVQLAACLSQLCSSEVELVGSSTATQIPWGR